MLDEQSIKELAKMASTDAGTVQDVLYAIERAGMGVHPRVEKVDDHPVVKAAWGQVVEAVNNYKAAIRNVTRKMNR